MRDMQARASTTAGHLRAKEVFDRPLSAGVVNLRCRHGLRPQRSESGMLHGHCLVADHQPFTCANSSAASIRQAEHLRGQRPPAGSRDSVASTRGGVGTFHGIPHRRSQKRAAGWRACSIRLSMSAGHTQGRARHAPAQRIVRRRLPTGRADRPVRSRRVARRR